jgi:hypothetical protein
VVSEPLVQDSECRSDIADWPSHNERMTGLRYLMWLSLIVWLGGLIFFAFVLAPTVFSVLPTRHLAGNVVNRSLGALHWMGLVSGLVFLGSSLIYSRLTQGDAHPFATRHVLLFVMLALTLISQFGISPRMASLRSSMGDIDTVAVTDPARAQFNALHVWSTRLEGGVLLFGLVVVYLTTKVS